MFSIGKAILSTSRIPDLHRVIIGTRGDALAIRRPPHHRHTIFMPVIGENMPAIGRIPDLHRVIIAARGDPPVIARPRYRSHWLWVSAINNMCVEGMGRVRGRDKRTERGSVVP